MIPFAYIPSPPENGFSIGPFFFHAYGIAYVFAVAAAIFVSSRLWVKRGRRPRPRLRHRLVGLSQPA